MPLWWRPACACNDGGPSEYCLVTGPSPVPDYNMIPAKTGDSFIYPDSATAGIISGKMAQDWREAFQTHRVPCCFLVCSIIYIIHTYLHIYRLQISTHIYTYLQSADIYTYLHNGMCPQLPVGAVAGLQLAGSPGVQLPALLLTLPCPGQRWNGLITPQNISLAEGLSAPRKS